MKGRYAWYYRGASRMSMLCQHCGARTPNFLHTSVVMKGGPVCRRCFDEIERPTLELAGVEYRSSEE